MAKQIIVTENQQAIVVTSPPVTNASVRLVGDVSGGFGTNVINTTLSTVLSNPGVYADPQITVNNKGLITAISSTPSTNITASDFIANTTGQTQFSLPYIPVLLLEVEINGIGYTSQFSISSPYIIYTPLFGDYIIQANDSIHVIYIYSSAIISVGGLLLENNGGLLLENGGRILLETSLSPTVSNLILEDGISILITEDGNNFILEG